MEREEKRNIREGQRRNRIGKDAGFCIPEVGRLATLSPGAIARHNSVWNFLPAST